MGLRAADTSATKRFEADGDWLVLRLQLTHGQAQSWGEMTQSRFAADPTAMFGGPVGKVELRVHLVEANAFLFEALCESWSLSAEPTAAQYHSLDEKSGQWVDECISTVMELRQERLSGNARRATATGTPSPASSRGRSRSAKKPD